MRAFALLLSSLLLVACTNMVRSQTPWFAAADAGDAPSLRSGVWAAVDPDCRFNADRPLEQWPACARGQVVRGGEALDLSFVESEGRGGGLRRSYAWTSEPFVLAAGSPRIHQRACGEPGGLRMAEQATEDFAGEAAEAADELVRALVYCYAGLRADALDREGQIVAFTTWPIWCGPFPRGAENERGPQVTDAPFPGLTVVGEHCIADGIAAIRAAATASEMLYAGADAASPLGPTRFRWIRDGWR